MRRKASELSDHWRAQAARLQSQANEAIANWELHGVRTIVPLEQATEIGEKRGYAEALEKCARDLEGMQSLIREVGNIFPYEKNEKNLEAHISELNARLTEVKSRNRKLAQAVEASREALRHLYKTARTGQWNSQCQRAWEAIERSGR